MRKRASSAELLAAVDFGDAVSNPLHNKMDFLWLYLTHSWRSRQNLRTLRRKTRFLTGYLAALTKIYQEKPG